MNKNPIPNPDQDENNCWVWTDDFSLTTLQFTANLFALPEYEGTCWSDMPKESLFFREYTLGGFAVVLPWNSNQFKLLPLDTKVIRLSKRYHFNSKSKGNDPTSKVHNQFNR